MTPRAATIPSIDADGPGPALAAVLHGILALFLAYFLFFVLLVGRQVPMSTFLALAAGGLAMLALSAADSRRAALLLAAAAPLISGLCVATGRVGYIALSFLFIGLFAGWYLQLVRGRSRLPGGPVPLLATLMLGLLLLSAASNALLLKPDYMILNIFSPRTFQQDSGLYFLHALNIPAQGLLFLLILHCECREPVAFGLWQVAVCHVATCVVLALSQLWVSGFSLRRGLFWPFEDIHSFGSALALMAVMLLSMGLRQRRAGLTALGGLAFVLCLMSWSRTAIIAAVSTMMLLSCCLPRTPARRLGAALAVVLAMVLVLGLSSRLNQMDIGLTGKSGLTGRTASSLQARLARWQRTLKISAKFPVAGTGIGTQFRIFHSHAGDDLVDNNRDSDPSKSLNGENTHNYLLQMQAEVGICYSLALICLLWMLVRPNLAPSQHQGPGRDVAMGLTAYAITLVGGHPLLLLSQQLLFFYYAAYVLASHPPRGVPSRYLDAMLVVALAVFVLASAFKLPRYHPTLLDGYGAMKLKEEKGRPLGELTLAPGPVTVQWLKPRGSHLGVMFRRIDPVDGPVTVSMSLDGKERETISLPDRRPVVRYYAVSPKAEAVEAVMRVSNMEGVPMTPDMRMSPVRSYAIPLPEDFTIR